MSASRDLTFFDSLSIEALRVDCIIGLFPRERVTPQPLELDVEVYLTAHHCNELGIAGTVDYGCLAGELRFLLKHSRFLFIEQAAESLARYVLAPPAPDETRVQVHAVKLKMKKPNALKGEGVPSISMTRLAGERTLPSGATETLSQIKTLEHLVQIERHFLAPKASWLAEESEALEAHELVLTEGLWVQGAPVKRGCSLHWAPGAVRRYENPSSKCQTLLRVTVTPTSREGSRWPQTEQWYPSGD